MAEIIPPEFKQKYHLSNRELKDILVTIFALGFFFSYSSWPSVSEGFVNFLVYSFLVGISFVLHIYVHKKYANSIECSTEYFLSNEFLFLGLILTVITNGVFFLPILGTVTVKTIYHSRIGYKYFGIRRREVGKIGFAGPLANLAFAILLKPFSGLNIVIFNLMRINLWLGLFNLLPIPPFDGSKLFISNRGGWAMSFVFATALFFILPKFGFLIAVPLSIIVAAVIGLLYLMPRIAG